NLHGGDPAAFALAICVGNEWIQRHGSAGLTDLNAARTRLLSKLERSDIPIVTSEDIARYTIVPELESWGAFLFPIIVPHWNVPDKGPADAAAWVRAQGIALADD